MTSKEEFEVWFNGAEFNAEYYPTEMYLAWQARGEVDAKRIAELEEQLLGKSNKCNISARGNYVRCD